MDYNARMSQQFRSQGQAAGGRGKQQQSDSNAFMQLPDEEIAGCISDIGVPFSPQDLKNPNPQQIQKVFEWFAELLLNATRETVEPAMRAAAEDVCGEYMEVVPADTRNLMGFYVSLRKLLVDCGINDFSFTDLLKPTYPRLVNIFSYIINFVRFRESQTAVIDEHFNKAETTKSRIESLYGENQDMESRLQEMRRERKVMDQQVKEKTRRNDELKQRLLELKRGQERIAERLEIVKTERGRLTGTLEDKTTRKLGIQDECKKLRPYVTQSPQALETELSELQTNLNKDRSQMDGLEQRARALQTSATTFVQVKNDVSSCIKVLEEVSDGLHKEDDVNLKAAKRRDALGERSNNVREVEHTESLLQRQLKRWTDRTEAIRQTSREKAQVSKEKMEELRAVHRKLNEERTDRQKEMERKRVKIEQTEKKMADLKENIEDEIRSSHEEFLKIDSHIRLYITEMEQSIY
ncbi:MAG: kinetochore-associated Ndc80 complex subunit nuf2 [Ramalina farinacea]|uniref:Probable kinetochore protein NUF2 n=1 Tax=Ramalina farinacea TaxID=258253 RepID=A0AA43QJC7_9LECA|nr:kinetochore-associated Ndc80 complex subunit nuf2 [Ramalina farinacea]